MRRTLLALAAASWLAGVAAAVEWTQTQAGRIAQRVGQILEHAHYQQYPLNDAMSEKFLGTYLDALDYNHMVFLQTDVDEFRGRYGDSLDDLTEKGDASPAFAIFERYLTRLEQRQQLVTRLLEESFDFTVEESFLAARNKLPWPKDESAMQSLWRSRVKYELLQGRLAKDKPEETRRVINKRYERLVKTMRKLEVDEILQTYLTALGHCYDPHSDYMSPREAENFDINNIRLKLTGIGALLRSEDGYAKIVSLVPGGPADLSKQMKPNDRIVAVTQGDGEPVDVVEEKLNKVVDMIRGERGTVVKLTVIPADAADGSVRKVVTLTRDEIKLKEQFAKARILDVEASASGPHRLGLISLPQFYANCAEDVERLITRLKKERVEGLLLDLRRNGGGILGEAVDLTGLFIGSGPVVQVRHPARPEPQIHRVQGASMSYDGPLVVLVGRMSASASEIVAAALQDYGRAVIVGDHNTHGKGTVQSLVKLDNFFRPGQVESPGELKLTVQKFYRVAGGTTQKDGVTPDIVLPSLLDYMEIGEASLPNCLPADTIKPASYRQFDLVTPHLAELNDRSARRASQSRDFAYLQEDIERLRKQQTDKSISLNESRRVREKEDLQARMDSRKKERATRPAELVKVFEVTLDTVDKDQALQPVVHTKPRAAGADKAPTTENVEDEADEAEGESALDGDVQLKEGLNILQDYVQLLGHPAARSPKETLATSPQKPKDPEAVSKSPVEVSKP